MIERATEMRSAADAALMFRRAIDGKDMQEVASQIMRAAKGEDETLAGLDAKDYAKVVLEYRRLALSYGLGRPRQQGETSAAIDLGDLDSTDACLAALVVIKDAQRDQLVTLEQAEDLRKTVAAAANIHRAQAGEALLDAIEEHGAVPFFLPANVEPEEGANRLKEYLGAQEGGADGA